MITGESPAPEISILWIPPKYEKVDEYCTRLYNERKTEFEIGILNDQPLLATLAQNVVC